MPLWLQVVIIMSLAAGICFAAFAMWFGLKEKQVQVGASMDELRDMVATQQKALEEAERRFQNLEAIVTSQAWDLAREQGLPEADDRGALPQARIDLDALEEGSSDAERTAQIARRLKT